MNVASDKAAPDMAAPDLAAQPLTAAREAERLHLIERLGFEREAARPSFRALAEALSTLLDLPVAKISVVAERNLILHEADREVVTLQRSGSMCEVVVRTGRPYVVEDLDPADFPALAEVADKPAFYVGIPLVTSTGAVLGSLCGFDERPRAQPDADMVAMLGELAKSAMAELELERAGQELTATERDLERETELMQATIETIDEGISAFDGDLKLIAWNRRVLDIFGLPHFSVVLGSSYAECLALLSKKGLNLPTDFKDRVARGTQIPLDRGDIEWEIVKGRFARLRRIALAGGGFLTAYRDVTDLHRRDAELEYSRRVQHWQHRLGVIANEASDVVSALSHCCAFAIEDLGWEIAHVSKVEAGGLVSTGVVQMRPGYPALRGHVASRLGGRPYRSRVAARCGPMRKVVIESGDLDFGDLGLACSMDRVVCGVACHIQAGDEAYVIEFYGSYAIVNQQSHLAVISHFEAQLTRVAERERISRLKDEFTAGVSRAVGPPLAAIRDILDRLCTEHTDVLTPDVLQMLAVAVGDARRLDRLVSNLLASQQIERGDLDPRFQSHDLETIVKEVVLSIDLAQPVVLVKENDALRVTTDRSYCVQILHNVLSNASKFSPPGEKIRITLAYRGNFVLVSIADRGPGISAQFQPRLFEKFAQADASDTRRMNGTGLGLAVSRGLARSLGGQLEHDPQTELGATFHLTLPLHGPKSLHS